MHAVERLILAVGRGPRDHDASDINAFEAARDSLADVLTAVVCKGHFALDRRVAR